MTNVNRLNQWVSKFQALESYSQRKMLHLIPNDKAVLFKLHLLIIGSINEANDNEKVTSTEWIPLSWIASLSENYRVMHFQS